MFKLDTLVQQIVAATGIPTHIGLDKLPETRAHSRDAAYVVVGYDRVAATSEADVLADSASELGNPLVMTTKVILVARLEQYPEIWMKVYQACLHFQPEFPIPPHQPLTFTFVSSDFYEDSGLWVSPMTWGYVFDRFWWGGECTPSALNPTGLYNPATITLP